MLQDCRMQGCCESPGSPQMCDPCHLLLQPKTESDESPFAALFSIFPKGKNIFLFMTINDNAGFILFLCPDSHQTPFGFFFSSFVQHMIKFTYIVLGVFEEQRRREEDQKFHKAGQMSRHKEEDNDDTGAPLTVWGGRSGKALFQYMRNSQYLVKKRKELQGWGSNHVPGAFGQHCGNTSHLSITTHPSSRLWQQDPDSLGLFCSNEVITGYILLRQGDGAQLHRGNKKEQENIK